MRLSGLDFLFWAAGLAANAALLFVLVYRNRARTFPIFTALIALNVIRTIVLYLVQRLASHGTYFTSYWSLTALDTVLQFGIVYEIAAIVFRPAGTWARDVRLRFVALLFPCIGIALALSWLDSPPSRTWVQAAVARGNLCAESLMSELFVLMLALSISAGLPWKTHVARIAQGLGTYSLVSLALQTGQSYFGVDRQFPMYVSLSHIRMIAYLGCVSYWIATLWVQVEQALPMSDELRKSLFALQARVAYDLKILHTPRNDK